MMMPPSRRTRKSTPRAIFFHRQFLDITQSTRVLTLYTEGAKSVKIEGKRQKTTNKAMLCDYPFSLLSFSSSRPLCLRGSKGVHDGGYAVGDAGMWTICGGNGVWGGRDLRAN